MSQEHAIVMMIVAKTHIRFIAKTHGFLSSLIKHEIEWMSSSGDNPAFQLFCIQAIDVFGIVSEFAHMVSLEYLVPFFHSLCYVLKNTSDEVGEM